MLLTLFSTALLTLLCSPAVCAALNIQTPVFTQCSPAQISWDNTKGPYDVLIANQSNQCGYAVADLGEHDTNSATWTVALPAGWQVMISIEDGTQDDAWSQPIVIQPSSNTSCLTPELAYLATHASASTSGSAANPSASASVGKQRGGNAPSNHHQIPSYTVVLLASTIAVVAASTFFVAL